MPFLSPSSSPRTSPRSKAVSKFNNFNTPVVEQSKGPLPVTYIPALIDGACGTTPNSRFSVVQQLRNDVSQSLSLLPSLLLGAVAARMNIAEKVQHVALALLEVHIFFSAVPLWIVLPGALFAAWIACCAALVIGMSWSLNGGGQGGQVVRVSSPTADGWTIGQEVDDEHWFYIGGIGTSSTSLTKKTLPALAKLFSKTIISVHEPTYGLLFDFLLLLLQRPLYVQFPSSASGALYIQIRTALLDSETNRTVVLAHNVGAVTMSHILRQLYADIPTERMDKLEIYTFGAAAAEFVTPLGGPLMEPKNFGKQQIHAPDFGGERRGPHIEHFAFSGDPFGRMGVLRSVHEDLSGRFCGSIFMLQCPGVAHHPPSTTRDQNPSKRLGKYRVKLSKFKLTSRPRMYLHDYMSCLFPDHSVTSHLPASGSSTQSAPSILDDVMVIDRSLAEKREFAALAKDPASHHTKPGANERRSSWTGLGAIASLKNGNMDGVMGLEIARKGCKDCSGHRGREVSRLVNYVCIPSHFNDNVEGMSP